MTNEIEELSAFSRVSRLVEYILEKFEVPSFIKPLFISYVWSNRHKCLEVDKEVEKIWSQKKS